MKRALALLMVSQTLSERSKAKGDLWSAIPTTSRSMDVGAKFFPEADTAGLSWLESPTDSPDRSFCLDIKSAARFRTPGIWTALMDKNLSCAQRRSWRACLFRVRERKPPWRLMWDTTAMLSVLTTSWECARNYQLVLFHVFWVGRCTGTRLLCLNTEKVRFSWYVTFPTFSRKRKKVLW